MESATRERPVTKKKDWADKPKEATIYDDAFWVKKLEWGTYSSVGSDGNKLVTSLTEHECISATRFYLKGKQEGWDDEKATTYSGTVGGKL